MADRISLSIEVSHGAQTSHVLRRDGRMEEPRREASRRIHVAQPAISQTISNLKTELGVKLLARSGGRSVKLTSPGATVLSGISQDQNRLVIFWKTDTKNRAMTSPISSWDFIDWFEGIAAQHYAVKKEHPPDVLSRSRTRQTGQPNGGDTFPCMLEPSVQDYTQ